MQTLFACVKIFYTPHVVRRIRKIMRALDAKEVSFVSGGYYCSHCPRNPDGSMVWIQGPNEPPYPPGHEPKSYFPSPKALAVGFVGGVCTGLLSGAKYGLHGAIASAFFFGVMGCAARMMYDYSQLSES